MPFSVLFILKPTTWLILHHLLLFIHADPKNDIKKVDGEEEEVPSKREGENS